MYFIARRPVRLSLSPLRARTGTSTLDSEVTDITSIGFWLLVDGTEYFVPFSEYPIFPTATVGAIFNVQQLAPGQLYWPEIDADIEIEALEHPEDYPLVWHDAPKKS